ncbi:ABC transporter substrate-binding protein [Frankia sp. AgB1.9]|uniref:ABC transporter substrate-binding protein n=1 Tax=unclassified Frankia TaxID=2632575 RepID=UPI001932CFDD|nr:MULTISPECIES: ABC transporter substrate-binding protein [unclassified Frankia]MBL7489423.1 ABC transporter substrate-binding protein [Frankia sp. AgW1.1]MBL7550642.1 ABC transporter substrate-binding protein [Frankia sp. AgB1.9]MBL7620983.1 ABC transporter substrate-binding protein [Frankia sp. AgB1.8]
MAIPLPAAPYRKYVVIIVATTIAAATMASCGVGGGSRQASSCGSPGVSADEVKIGVVYPDAGSLGGAVAAARSGINARLQLANTAGGVNGRKVSYEWRDDSGTPQGNDQAVRALVNQVGVFGLVEATTAGSGGEDFLRAQGVPAVGLPVESIWSNASYQNLFSFPSSFDGPPVDTFGRFVRAQGGTRAVVVTDSTAVSTDFSRKVEQSLGAAHVPYEPVTFNPKISNPEVLAEHILKSGADVLVVGLGGDDVAGTVAAVRSAGAAPKVILGVSGYNKSTIQNYGRAAAGLTTFLKFVPFEARVPAQRVYLKAMVDYAPELQPPDQEVAYGSYIATDLFLRGLAAAGSCPSRQSFITGLRAVTDYDAGGLLAGKVDFSHDGNAADNCYTFVRVNQSGTGFEIVPNATPGAPNPSTWCGEPIPQ